MKSLSLNCLPTSCTLIGFSLLLLTSYLVLPVKVNAAVDVDTSEMAEQLLLMVKKELQPMVIAFGSITNDIAGGKFSHYLKE